jgi:hypothetical protein
VIGKLQVTIASKEDTLPDIARRFNLGLRGDRAAPIPVWIPGCRVKARDRAAHAVRAAQCRSVGHR